MRTMALSRPTLAPAATVLALCCLIGAAMSLRNGYAPLMIVGATTAVVALRWRAGVVALLVLLPFSGVPAFVAGNAGLGLRDVCVVAPLYVAFGVTMTRSRERVLPELGIGGVALVIFAAVVVLQTTRAPTALAGAIAARVWLAYLPMLAVGYVFVRGAADFQTILKLTALLGIVPAGVALAECVFAVSDGGFGAFERMYGAWQLTETQRFVVFTTDAGHLRIPRVPSTFTGVSQYFVFSLVAYSAALAMTMRDGSARWLVVAALLAAGAIGSGARASYVAVPAIGALSVLLAGRPSLRFVAVCGGACAAGAVALIAGDGLQVAHELPSHAAVTLRTSLDELRSSFTWAGHGNGWDTNAALRYGGVADRRYVESWYAKAMLELGVAGVIAIIVAFASIGWRSLGALRSPSLDARSRRMAAPVLALVLVTMVLLVKGPYVDLDPLNVYFWLLLGALFGLFRGPAIGAATAGGRSDAGGDA